MSRIPEELLEHATGAVNGVIGRAGLPGNAAAGTLMHERNREVA